MENLSKRITVELENIQSVLTKIPSSNSLHKFNPLEQVGIAALILSFYNGIENVIKQIVVSKKIAIPSGDRWHKDLLDLSLMHKIISKATYTALAKYLTFRHFFTHSYAYEIDPDRLEVLVKDINKTYNSFTISIKKFI